MQPAEKIAVLAEAYRHGRYPEPLIAAIVRYLEGQGDLGEVQRQWHLARSSNSYWSYTSGAVVIAREGHLDSVDLRLLEVFHAVGELWISLGPVVAAGFGEPARDYLLRHGVSEQDFLDACMRVIGSAIDFQQHATPLGRMLLEYVPDRFDDLVQSAMRNPHGWVWTTLIALLLSAEPPHTDLAWQLAQQLATTIGYGSGEVAARLLQIDPVRFTPWARQVAGPKAPGNENDRQRALEALLDHDWQAHIDLAIEATRTPVTSRASWDAGLQQFALKSLASYFKAEQYRDLAVELSLSPHPTAAFVAEAAATMRRIRQPALLWHDPALVGLHWASGDAVPTDIIAYILYRQSRIKEPQLDPCLRPVLAALDRATAAEWALTLWNDWIAHNQDAKTAWCLTLAGALGDDRLAIPLRARIDEWTKANRGAVAARGAYALVALGTDLALSEVDSIASRSKHAQVKVAAQQALRDAAQQAGLTTEELADRIVPRLGFDACGEQVLEYGARRLTIHLGLDLTLDLRDEQGAPITALPKPGKSDDPKRAAAAQATWKQLKAQLKQVMKLQTERLERALVDQRSWEAGRWRELFLSHPLLRSLAVRLVWIAETPDNPQILFRPLEDGSYTDIDDEPVELPPSGYMRLAHPVCLDEEMLGAWRRHLADYEITQPFLQISRPIMRTRPEERDAIFWTAYERYLMNGGALKGRYLKAGWQRGGVGDGGAYYTLLKPFPAAGLIAVLETAGLAINIEQEFNTALKRLAFVRVAGDAQMWYGYDGLRDDEPGAVRLGSVPAVVFSEAAVDVQSFAAAGQYDAEWERKVW